MEGSQKIKKGYKFKFLDQAWVIEEIFDNGLILIYLENNLRTRKIVTLSYFTDEILKESKDIKAANPSLAKYKKIEIKKQFHKLYAKMASSKIPDPVGAAAYILNISRSTGYSWLKELKSGSHLIVEYRIDAYKPKLNKETERLTQEAVDALHASTAGTSKSAMYRTLSKRLATEGLPPVSYTTFCRRTVNRPLVERLSAAQGSQARERYRPTKTGDVGSEPLDLVEVDHWMIDLIVVSERDRSPVGVAYLTLLLDTATRVVLGYYLSLDPPNQFAVGRALLSAFTPKTSLLHHLGIEGEWPCWGVPKRLRPDNAKEFKSQLLQDLALKYRIVLTHARPYHPRDKAKIEAFFGTLSGFMKELPGSTKVTPVGPSSRAGEASAYAGEIRRAALELSGTSRWMKSAPCAGRIRHPLLDVGTRHVDETPLVILKDDQKASVYAKNQRSLALEVGPQTERPPGRAECRSGAQHGSGLRHPSETGRADLATSP
ncbi:hypothetical protein [Deinococcus soli (ex Cha et al. 2016)]|uniref:hypothetical protein n=1 Tax=Deinococcus soli (ex Cha et al. 2016) TaxID=1309411 RepID=UPI0036D42A2D